MATRKPPRAGRTTDNITKTAARAEFAHLRKTWRQSGICIPAQRQDALLTAENLALVEGSRQENRPWRLVYTDPVTAQHYKAVPGNGSLGLTAREAVTAMRHLRIGIELGYSGARLGDSL